MNPDEKQTVLAALRLQMLAAGITPEELAAGAVSRLPTVKEAVANIENNNRYTGKTLKTYRTAWTLFVETHPNAHLDDLTFEDIETVAGQAQEHAAARWERRNQRRRAAGQLTYDYDGSGAFETAVRALRAVYKREYRKAGLAFEASPAHQVDIPSRRPNARRPLTRDEVRLVFDIATTGGDDPVLDGLILRTGYETGARQEGILNLRQKDVNRDRQTVTLDEKFGKRREQPVTIELLEELLTFAHERGARDPEDAVFRYRPRAGRPGTPLTSRRFDTLVTRLRGGHPDLEALHFVYHLMRHTIGRRIRKVGGKAVARDFLGHGSGSGDVTDGYTRSLRGEVANAWIVVMGVQHPLATDYDPGW